MSEKVHNPKIILIGAGIMSATLGTLLKELEPNSEITVYEKLSNVGEESSNEWNNAGTGHAALCELNYTTEQSDGSIDIDKAIKVNEEFQTSLQFWSYLVDKDLIENPKDFIRGLPHMSFVQGDGNVAFLKKRFNALSQVPLFKGMEYTDDANTLKEWFPLMMEGRSPNEKVAATKANVGTDVNFGSLTRKLFEHLRTKDVHVKCGHMVEDIKRNTFGNWDVTVRDMEKGKSEIHTADFVFIGSGGASLPLLQKSGISEGKNVGGFPVSGLFMVCNNPQVIEKHHGKVYGKAKVGAPPMSVPHLDTRFIDGKKTLLFGPFAGFTPKFLKSGSAFDLLGSVQTDNVVTMLTAGAKNIPLTKYLIQQVLLSKEKRMEELREFVPNAKSEDWDIVVAGQRVQIIKDTPSVRGVLQFGTEVISSSDGSIAALLGASPGASTAIHVMLEVLEKSFPERIEEWKPRINEMIPSYGVKLSEHPELFQEIHSHATHTLKLENK